MLDKIIKLQSKDDAFTSKIDCLIRAEAQGEAGPLFSIIISLGPRGKGGPPERRGEGRRT